MKQIKIKMAGVSFSFGKLLVLDDVSVQIPEKTVTAITGPSGQGKSTFLMLLNRLWETIPEARLQGTVHVRLRERWADIYDPSLSLPELRRAVGLVFQKPNPLPMSIYKNMAFPLKLAGLKEQDDLQERVESSLKQSFLWDEVKDRLAEDARNLSGGQQQRLCIARALTLKPEVLLLDEPTSSLDRQAAAVIEELIGTLKGQCTLLIVSHNQAQVSRLADEVLELKGGKLFSKEENSTF